MGSVVKVHPNAASTASSGGLDRLWVSGNQLALADSFSVADQKRFVYSVLPSVKAGPCGLPLCFGTLSVAL